jgi:hypothetical protein
MYYLIQDFKNGLDRRRKRTAQKAGALWTLENAHITPGGDIEKRMAFVPMPGVDLSGTMGLAGVDESIFVFNSSGSAGAGITAWSSGMTLQPGQVYLMQLPGVNFTRVHDWELFDGKLYVTVAGSDGQAHHFYDGKPVSGLGWTIQTYRNKMYAVDTSKTLYFSAVSDPTNWSPFLADGKTESGAGFINVANYDGNSVHLTSLEPYYEQLALFSYFDIQFWDFKADPKASQMGQVLRNSGTIAHLSPCQYGNGDVLYLATSGIRSLKARSQSNAAGITDVGSAIDKFIQSDFATLGQDTFSKAFALVHPLEGRFWMVLNDTIYVLSFFPGPDVSAWSVYKPGFTPIAGTGVGQKLALRDADKIYLYGGTDGQTYDKCKVTAETSYLTADKPSTFKAYSAVDLVCDNKWRLEFGLDAKQPSVYETAGIYDGNTLNNQQMAIRGFAPSIGFKLTCEEDGQAQLAQLIFHYEEAYAS